MDGGKERWIEKRKDGWREGWIDEGWRWDRGREGEGGRESGIEEKGRKGMKE